MSLNTVYAERIFTNMAFIWLLDEGGVIDILTFQYSSWRQQIL